MRSALILPILAALAAAAVFGQESAPKAQDMKPMAAMAWLVGGVWTADASKMGGGMQRIETRYAWSDNNAYIRFNTHFVTDKATLKRYDGQFFWSPEQSTLAMWYMDTRNAITQGPVQVDGDLMQITFRGMDFEGKMADLRVNVARKTNDRYTWTLEEKGASEWKTLASLEYVRTPEQ